jgi:hypothetical protein
VPTARQAACCPKNRQEHVEIGVDTSGVGYACDVVLYSEFDSHQSLAAYAVPGLPILAIPGTYAGSEMTPICGMTEDKLADD